MTADQYLAARLAVLREQRRQWSGPITSATYQLEGEIAATEHALAAVRKHERGQL